MAGASRRAAGTRIDLRSALPAEAAVEFEGALHCFDREAVGVAAEGFEHAHEVSGVGDGGAEAFADRFVVGAVAEVVVAPGAGRLEHDLDLARGALQLEHRLAPEILLAQVERLPVDAL